MFVVGAEVRGLCPDLVEEDVEGRELRLRGRDTLHWFWILSS